MQVHQCIVISNSKRCGNYLLPDRREQLNKNMGLQILLLLLAAMLLDNTNAQRLDTVDSCLFTCDYCFKGEILLNCANACLMSEMDGLNPIWKSVCPYFAIPNFMEG